MKSIKGIVIGVVLFFASLVLLYWNEGRVDLSKIAENAVPLAATPVTTDAAMQGQMVSVTGDMSVDSPLGDAEFMVPGDYLALEREVEMYAWIEDQETESETSVGGSETTTTTYTYRKDWTDSPESSSSFKQSQGHENPPMPFDSLSLRNDASHVGDYGIDMNGIRLRGLTTVEAKPVPSEREEPAVIDMPPADTDGDGLTDETEASLGTNAQLADTDGDTLDDGMEVEAYGTDPTAADTDGDGYDDASEIDGGFEPTGEGEMQEERLADIESKMGELEETKAERAALRSEAEAAALAAAAAPAEPETVLHAGKIYIGKGSPTSPEVGDVRIGYRALAAGQVGTAFGQLSNDIIAPYLDKDGNRVHSLSAGTREAALSGMHEEYVTSLWLLRLFGLLLMWIGLSMVLAPISVLLDVLPMLGRFSRSVVGLVTLVISLILSLLTIVVSRLLHSPVAIFVTLVLAAIGGFLLFKRYRGRSEAVQPEAVPSQAPPEPPQQ